MGAERSLDLALAYGGDAEASRRRRSGYCDRDCKQLRLQ
jgi:hypothetical protein